MQRRLTLSPSTAFLIPLDSIVSSSRSSSAPIVRLNQRRGDRFSRLSDSSISSLGWHVMRIGEMNHMLELCVLYKCLDVIFKIGYECNVPVNGRQGCQYIFTQLLDMLLELLQIFHILFPCLWQRMVSQCCVLKVESRTSIRWTMRRMLPTAAFAPAVWTLPARASSASFRMDMMVFFTNCDGWRVAMCWIGDWELLDCDEFMVSDG